MAEVLKRVMPAKGVNFESLESCAGAPGLDTYDDLLTAAAKYSEVFEQYDESCEVAVHQRDCGGPADYLRAFTKAYPPAKPDEPDHAKRKIAKFKENAEGDLKSTLRNPLSPARTWGDVLDVVGECERRYQESSVAQHMPAYLATQQQQQQQPPKLPAFKQCKHWRAGHCSQFFNCPYVSGHTLDEFRKDETGARQTDLAFQMGRKELGKQGPKGGQGGTGPAPIGKGGPGGDGGASNVVGGGAAIPKP